MYAISDSILNWNYKNIITVAKITPFRLEDCLRFLEIIYWLPLVTILFSFSHAIFFQYRKLSKSFIYNNITNYK